MPFTDPIEIAAATRSQFKQESDANDGNTGSVILSDETIECSETLNLKKCRNQTILCMLCG